MKTLPTTKRCRYCVQIRPIDLFRRVRKNGEARRNECDACNRKRVREHYRRIRDREAGHTVQKASAEICRADSTDHIMALTEALVDEFGGIDQLAAEWRRIYDEACRKGRNRRAVLMLRANMRLILLSDELNHRKYCEFLALAPEKAGLQYAVEQHPEVAAHALAELGWNVEAPT